MKTSLTVMERSGQGGFACVVAPPSPAEAEWCSSVVALEVLLVLFHMLGIAHRAAGLSQDAFGTCSHGIY